MECILSDLLYCIRQYDPFHLAAVTQKSIRNLCDSLLERDCREIRSCNIWQEISACVLYYLTSAFSVMDLPDIDTIVK